MPRLMMFILFGLGILLTLFSCSKGGKYECLRDEECGPDEICVNGQCEGMGFIECNADADCGPDHICINQKCYGMGFLECTTDEQCGPEHVCINNKCEGMGIIECTTDEACGPDHVCIDQKCYGMGMLECTTDKECGPDHICINNKCYGLGVLECTTNEECGPEHICVNSKCEGMGLLECTTDDECGEGNICFENKCYGMGMLECLTDEECGEGNICFENKCYGMGELECQTDEECGGEGHICVNNKCYGLGDLECTTDGECGEEHVCFMGKCEGMGLLECDTSEDCGPDHVCVNNKCYGMGMLECATHEECGDEAACIEGKCKGLEEVTYVTIEDKDEYYHVTLDMTQDTPYNIGRFYGLKIRKILPDYETMISQYIEGIRHFGYLGYLTYGDLKERVNNIKPSLLDEHKQLIEGFGASLKGNNDLTGLELAYVMNLMPDIVRISSCSAFGINPQRTDTGRTIMTRILDWPGLELQNVNKIHAVVKYINGEKSLYTISYLGILSVISGFNNAGIFGAILDSMVVFIRYESENKRSYVFDLREALETQKTLNGVANFMADPLRKYTFNHLIWLSDKYENAVLENNMVEPSNFYGNPNPQRRLRRDIDPMFNNGHDWEQHPGVLGTVNCFMLSLNGSIDNCYWQWNSRRLEKMEDQYQLVGGKDKLSVDDMKTIMQYHRYPEFSPGDMEKGDIYNDLTQQIIIFEPETLKLEIFFAPKVGALPPTPYYTTIPISFD